MTNKYNYKNIKVPEERTFINKRIREMKINCFQLSLFDGNCCYLFARYNVWRKGTVEVGPAGDCTSSVFIFPGFSRFLLKKFPGL
jgi:hypothetical protein